MKKIALIIFTSITASVSFGQQTEGKVIYSRVMQMNIQIAGNEQMQSMIPKSRTDKFELSFANNQSVVKHMDEDENTDEIGGNGMQIRMMAPGQNDIVFHDFKAGKRVTQTDVMDKKYLIVDSIRKLDWKLTGETKTILGHVCQKATAQRTGKRTQMNMDNGKLEKKEVNDTTNIVAWFTNDIPVPAGPEMQGQLPGLILGLDLNNGRQVYTATDISVKSDVASIKEPSKGKKVTPEEFSKEREKLMEELRKNNQGNGNRQIRISN